MAESTDDERKRARDVLWDAWGEGFDDYHNFDEVYAEEIKVCAMGLAANRERAELDREKLRAIDKEWNAALAQRDEARTENERLQQWVNDLQAGMYINCVYCGHQYGPDDEVPATMAEVLKEHIAVCPKHPLAEARAKNERLREAARKVLETGGVWLGDLTEKAAEDGTCSDFMSAMENLSAEIAAKPTEEPSDG